LRLATGATRAAKNVPAVNGLLSFRVKNLDEVCKVLKTKGVEFLAEPHQQEWGGRTALILDPDKNVVVLCEAEKQGSA
jgi:predicted enzyme related to lactoylglutathione lyase